MLSQLDIRSLHAAVCAISAMDMSPLHRIKSILQVTKEYFDKADGQSITAYEFNRTTETLELIAMPGVKAREFMRGSTENRPVLIWDKTTSHEDTVIKWIENEHEYSKYIGELQKNADKKNILRLPVERSFRSRQDGGELAVAKVILHRGLGTTNDRVGQLFFNFRVADSGKKRFTPKLKSAIRFVSCLVREILISKNYSFDYVDNTTNIEFATQRLNQIFDRERSEQVTPQTIDHMEREIAQTIREAALKITDNRDGVAEFGLLLGEKLLRVFISEEYKLEGEPAILHNDSITLRCITDQITYNHPNITSEIAKNDIGLQTCKSLMIVPVRLGTEVRGIIKVGSSKCGAFSDTHCRGMTQLERIARSAIVFLDERKQRAQMARALDFYVSDFSLDSDNFNDAPRVMSCALSALDADWGSYWPIDAVNNGGYGDKFMPISASPNIQEPVHTEDKLVGIRAAKSSNNGFTTALLRMDRLKQLSSGAFFALHILASKQSGARYKSEPYYLQIFAPKQQNVETVQEEVNWTTLADGSKLAASTENNPIPALKNVHLNENTQQQHAHTRVAFIVHNSENKPIGIMWIIFKSIHEIAWWERRYICGLANSLGRMFSSMDLALAVKSFQHKVPSQATSATEAIEKLIEDKEYLLSQDPSVVSNYLETIRTALYTIRWQTCEVKTLLSKQPSFPVRPIAEFMMHALRLVTSAFPPPRAWKVFYDSPETETQIVDGVFYPIVYNLLANAKTHGWKSVEKDEELTCIWIRISGDKVLVVVGDNGTPPSEDPLLHYVRYSNPSEHGRGLRLIKALAKSFGGEISFFLKDVLNRRSAQISPPELMKECNTFFEFSLPLPNPAKLDIQHIS